MLLKLAWRNIWRNKRRTVITVVSIAFAVILSSVMRSMQLGSYERMIDNSVRFLTGYIQVHKKGYWDEQVIDNAFEPPPQLKEKIGAIENVEAAVPRLESFALASYQTQTKGAMIIGIDPEKESSLSGVEEKIVEGEIFDINDQQVLVGNGLADYLKLGIGDTIVLISQGYHGVNAAGKYPVSGLVKFGLPQLTNQVVFMPLPAAQYFFGADQLLTALAVVTDHPKHVGSIQSAIQQEVDTTELEVLNWKIMMPELIQGIEIDNISGIIMLLLLYVVIGFGMFGTFLMMTTERMYEFGVLLSVGMRRYKLQLVIFAEIIMLAMIAVLVGFALSLPVISYFYKHPITLPEEYKDAFEKFGIEPIYVFSLEPVVFTSQAWVVFFMALVLGSYPLYKIWKLDPVTAMKEGR
ncbi:FtsX-like permease family protein [Echinicola jeungdonensis]|uniref:ABC transporter permease n=1 Tax=Echinicola jeungdonensis TaxID=709343 RepID=A0ABV5J5B7_9BACT|nr:ABC transporter permease [Echinicola jeungdonensis]MDN3668216.1 FtsX-like permease family protein [Echinicola jeungdonensis]